MSKCFWYVTAGISHKGGADNRIELFYGNRTSTTIAGPFNTREEAAAEKDRIVSQFKTNGKVPSIPPRKAVINSKKRPIWVNPRREDKDKG